MKTESPRPRLAVNRETVRRLEEDDLGSVEGGAARWVTGNIVCDRVSAALRCG